MFVLTDRGTEFDNKLLKELMRLLKVRLHMTPAYAASKSTRTRHFRHLHFISSRDACLVNHFGVNPVDRRFALAATGARRSGSSGTLLTSVRCLQPLGTELSTARVRKAVRARAVAAAEWVGNLVDGLLVHAAGWEGGVLLPVELQALGGEGAFWLKHPEMTPAPPLLAKIRAPVAV